MLGRMVPSPAPRQKKRLALPKRSRGNMSLTKNRTRIARIKNKII